jgi:hypothetical protein
LKNKTYTIEFETKRIANFSETLLDSLEAVASEFPELIQDPVFSAGDGTVFGVFQVETLFWLDAVQVGANEACSLLDEVGIDSESVIAYITIREDGY